LVVYGISSFVYRIVVFAGLIWFVSGRFLLLGALLGLFCLFSWGVVPLSKFLNYLATSPQLDRSRPRAVAVTAGIALTLIVAFGYLPAPQTLRAPGVLRPVTVGDVSTGVEGMLAG